MLQTPLPLDNGKSSRSRRSRIQPKRVCGRGGSSRGKGSPPRPSPSPGPSIDKDDHRRAYEHHHGADHDLKSGVACNLCFDGPKGTCNEGDERPILAQEIQHPLLVHVADRRGSRTPQICDKFSHPPRSAGMRGLKAGRAARPTAPACAVLNVGGVAPSVVLDPHDPFLCDPLLG
jgi:hypothetical protein